MLGASLVFLEITPRRVSTTTTPVVRNCGGEALLKTEVGKTRDLQHAGYTIGCGSKLNNQGTADFSSYFHVPGLNFGHPFLTCSQLIENTK